MSITTRAKTTRRRALRAALGALSVASAVVMLSSDAASADSTQTVCPSGGAYVNEAVWQTSTHWGRAAERVCWEYSSTQVRAVGQFRVDWPSNCSLSLGYGAASVGCPPVSFKAPWLSFYTVQIPLVWAGPDGIKHSASCSWSNRTAVSFTSMTLTCDSPWMAIQKGGRYYSGLNGLAADVKNDGDGLKALAPVGQYLHFT